jgi:hypothetical protein
MCNVLKKDDIPRVLNIIWSTSLVNIESAARFLGLSFVKLREWMQMSHTFTGIAVYHCQKLLNFPNYLTRLLDRFIS